MSSYGVKPNSKRKLKSDSLDNKPKRKKLSPNCETVRITRSKSRSLVLIDEEKAKVEQTKPRNKKISKQIPTDNHSALITPQTHANVAGTNLVSQVK